MTTAWLIEWNGTDQTLWWAGSGAVPWTNHPNCAVRFARKEDADAAIRALQLGNPGVLSTEHMWSDAIAGGTQPMPSPDAPRTTVTVEVPPVPGDHKAVCWAVVGMSKDTELRDPDDGRRVDALIYMDPLEAMNHGREDCYVQPLVLAGVYNDPPGIFTALERDLRRKLDARNEDCQRLAGMYKKEHIKAKRLESELERIERAARTARLGR